MHAHAIFCIDWDDGGDVGDEDDDDEDDDDADEDDDADKNRLRHMCIHV